MFEKIGILSNIHETDIHKEYDLLRYCLFDSNTLKDTEKMKGVTNVVHCALLFTCMRSNFFVFGSLQYYEIINNVHSLYSGFILPKIMGEE